MKRETVKALLENGVLQAYAEGREIEINNGNVIEKRWELLHEDAAFKANPEDYRIKPVPQFKVGDLVRDLARSGRRIAKIIEKAPKGYYLVEYPDGSCTYRTSNSIAPVREVLQPLTFEQAVKLVAEKGVKLTDSSCDRTIKGLSEHFVDCRHRGVWEYHQLVEATFPDGTPFANVTYEDIT